MTASGLAALRTKMTKKYGEGRVMKRANVQAYDVIPTGSISLDLALRTGGFARGRMHEIVGPPAQGKTSLAITTMANAQKKYPDLAVGYIDMESTFDYTWAEKLGLDTTDERFLHVYPDDSEDVSDQLRAMADTGAFSVIVVDSIGGMESRKAFEKDAEDVTMGKNAQVITRMVKQVAGQARKNNVAVLLINQYRADISMSRATQASAGPFALRYATSTKVELARTGTPQLKVKMAGEDEIVGTEVKAKVSRNKLAAPGKSATYWFLNQVTEKYGPIGIDQLDESITVGKLTGVIKQRGAWYDLPDGQTIQSLDKVKEYLLEHPETVQIIRTQALTRLSGDVNIEEEVEFVDQEAETDDE